MSIFPHFLRSLLLTSLLSFVVPVLMLGTVLVVLSAIGYIPGIDILGQIGTEKLVKFLIVFGDGYPLQGLLTIGLTCALVGSLFDLFNFYRYQNIRN